MAQGMQPCRYVGLKAETVTGVDQRHTHQWSSQMWAFDGQLTYQRNLTELVVSVLASWWRQNAIEVPDA